MQTHFPYSMIIHFICWEHCFLQTSLHHNFCIPYPFGENLTFTNGMRCLREGLVINFVKKVIREEKSYPKECTKPSKSCNFCILGSFLCQSSSIIFCSHKIPVFFVVSDNDMGFYHNWRIFFCMETNVRGEPLFNSSLTSWIGKKTSRILKTRKTHT